MADTLAEHLLTGETSTGSAPPPAAEQSARDEVAARLGVTRDSIDEIFNAAARRRAARAAGPPEPPLPTFEAGLFERVLQGAPPRMNRRGTIAIGGKLTPPPAALTHDASGNEVCLCGNNHGDASARARLLTIGEVLAAAPVELPAGNPCWLGKLIGAFVGAPPAWGECNACGKHGCLHCIVPMSLGDKVELWCERCYNREVGE